MLGIIKLLVHLDHTQVTLKLIVCETLAASAIIGADCCEQYVKGILPKQKLVELDCGDCIPIERKFCGRMRL